jgi:hypothetical protein
VLEEVGARRVGQPVGHRGGTAGSSSAGGGDGG